MESHSGVRRMLSRVAQVIGLILLITGYVLAGFEMVFLLPPWSWQLMGALTFALSIAYMVHADRVAREELETSFAAQQLGAHPDDWEWEDDGVLQIPPRLKNRSKTQASLEGPRKANDLEDEVFALRQTNKRLEQDVGRLGAWKKRTSDWEDKIDRLERVESEHKGCAERVAALTKAVSRSTTFFADQAGMLEADFGYDKVFDDEGVRSVWIATVVGGGLSEMADGPLGEKLGALILANPDSAFLKYLFTARGDETRLG